MKLSLRRQWAIALMGLVLMLMSPPVGRSENELDPLGRPAIKTVLAEKSVLLSVAATGNRIVAVGERGIILISDDNGLTWRQADVPLSVTLISVRFASELKGWALGHSGVVLYTKDGGDTWEKQLDGGEAASLILKDTKEKAESGQYSKQQVKRKLFLAQQFVDDGTDKPFLDLYCINEQHVIIVGAYNLIFWTENSGISWQPRLDYIDNPRGMHLYGIKAVGNDLFIAGEQGVFFRSEDHGETFNALATPYEGSYFGVQSLNNGDLIIFGLRGNAFKSEDRGLTWRTVDTGISVSITAADKLRDGTLVLTTQAGDVLVSKDNGESFNFLKIDQPFPLAGVTQAANGNLVLVGVRGVKVISGSLTLVNASEKLDGEPK